MNTGDQFRLVISDARAAAPFRTQLPVLDLMEPTLPHRRVRAVQISVGFRVTRDGALIPTNDPAAAYTIAMPLHPAPQQLRSHNGGYMPSPEC